MLYKKSRGRSLRQRPISRRGGRDVGSGRDQSTELEHLGSHLTSARLPARIEPGRARRALRPVPGPGFLLRARTAAADARSAHPHRQVPRPLDREAGRGVRSTGRGIARHRHRASAPGPRRPLGQGSRRARRLPTDRGDRRTGRIGPGAGPAHPRGDPGDSRVEPDQSRTATGLRPDGQAASDATAGLAGRHRPGHRPARRVPRRVPEGGRSLA